jgi:hypothetical protein
VTSAKIADGTIATGDIADQAVTAAKIANDTITAAQIAANAVSRSETGSHTRSPVQRSLTTIATGDIDSAVTSAKIADGTIATGDIARPPQRLPQIERTTRGQIAVHRRCTGSDLADNAVDTAGVSGARYNVREDRRRPDDTRSPGTIAGGAADLSCKLGSDQWYRRCPGLGGCSPRGLVGSDGSGAATPRRQGRSGVSHAAASAGVKSGADPAVNATVRQAAHRGARHRWRHSGTPTGSATGGGVTFVIDGLRLRGSAAQRTTNNGTEHNRGDRQRHCAGFVGSYGSPTSPPTVRSHLSGTGSPRRGRHRRPRQHLPANRRG